MSSVVGYQVDIHNIFIDFKRSFDLKTNYHQYTPMYTVYKLIAAIRGALSVPMLRFIQALRFQ